MESLTDRPPHDRAVGPSDDGLLDLIQHGDRGAAGELYQRYADRLREIVGRRHPDRLSDADDVLQSAFRTFLAGADQGHYHVPDGSDLWALLVTVVLNKLRSHARKAVAAKRVLPRANTSAASNSATASADPALAATVRDVIEYLPPPEREVVELRLAAYSVPEIAQKLGRSRRTVERNLQSSRDRLTQLGVGYD
ncbi:RNA polymerase sigma factor [Limnoglobus roseus]|uniref:Sigma-70 family RNA polymerase sigma factor n=1 Tax=Limnoglobus roseus TaxID=2598579 RepID=A0A5C1AMZ9_9BACT|nr:sigma-70 family RNA polymerase sigma factor [Limnoglobus roseus]QEL19517.1 sigma-70 family RNA polymerase sigma factor [Limnoglobus roseus]